MGAMERARFYADMLSCDVGMFYKRRDLSKLVDGKNPIVEHAYMGADVEGKTVIVVDENSSNQRFDRFLRKYCKNYPTTKLTDIYSAIRKWEVLINSKKSKEDYRIQIWDKISFPSDLFWKKEHISWISFKQKLMKKLTKEDILPLILYEDAERIAFNKPIWIVAHESNKHRKDLSMNDEEKGSLYLMHLL